VHHLVHELVGEALAALEREGHVVGREELEDGFGGRGAHVEGVRWVCESMSHL
jgi:hypothetical protein